MPDEKATQVPPTPAPQEVIAPEQEELSLLDGGDIETGKTTTQTPEQIAAAEAEEKRLMDAADESLSDEEKQKKADIVKAREDKRILEAKDDKLSAEEKAKKAALLKAQEDAKKGRGAPEKYTDFAMPEGVEVNPLMLEEFKTVAKELDLTQDAAQKLVDLQAKHTKGISENLFKTFKDTVTTWKKETVQELGTDYKKELVYAGKAIDKFGSFELRQILNQTGVGNHKELVNFFVRVGKTISEDTFVDGKNRTGKKSDGELFYGESMSQK